MRFLFVVLAMTAISTLVSAQYYASAKPSTGSVSPIVANRAKPANAPNIPGRRMRDTGRTLTVVGGVLFAAGVALVATADELYYETTYSSSGTVEEGDPQGAFGVLMIAGGTGMIIPGIILWSKGSKKYKKHLSEQKASVAVKGTGLALGYRF